MVLINLTGIQPTGFTLLAENAQPKEGENVAVTVERLFAEDSAFFDTAGGVGAVITTDTPYAELDAIASKLAFAVIEFPAFGDGRGFSLAVRLRKDFGFKGEIRAIGPVIPDQALFLLRAGFDTVDVTDERKSAFEAALSRFPGFYQSDFSGQTSIAHARHTAGNSIEGHRKAS